MDFAGFTIRSFGVGMMTFVFVTLSCWAKCPDSSIPLILDNAKGNWSLVAATPRPDNTPNNCGRLEVTQKPNDTFYMILTTLSPHNNETVRLHFLSYSGHDMEVAWYTEGTHEIFGPLKYRIIYATRKYNTYWIMIVCDEKRKVIPRGEFAMILSREYPISTHFLTHLKNTLSEYVPLEDIIDVDHTNCGTIY